MLVLSRRPGEKNLLPGLGVTVQVLAIRRGEVRLGIQAPPDVHIVREELVGTPRREADRKQLEPCAR